MKKMFVCVAVIFTAACFAAPVTLPFKSDPAKKQTGFGQYGKVVNNEIHSDKKYCFGDVWLPKSEKNLKVIFEVKGTPEAKLEVCLFSLNEKGLPAKSLLTLSRGKTLSAKFRKEMWLIPAELLKSETRLFYYNSSKKPEIVIKSIRVDYMQEQNK